MAHHREQRRNLPTGARHHRFDLGAAAHSRADAVDGDIQDLVAAVADPELPVHFNRLTLRAGDLTGHNHPGRIGSAAGYPECAAAVLYQQGSDEEKAFLRSS